MERNTLIQHVQLNILERYDVLLDCSKLDDHTLARLSKRLPKVNGAHTTFASWCEHVLGDMRPAVARFGPAVPGQMHVEKLRLGLSERLKLREKAQKVEVKQLHKRIAELQAERSAVSVDRQPNNDIKRSEWIHRWQCFYAKPRDMLLDLLEDVKDIEGPHREYQGEPNSTFRAEIVQAVRGLLEQLQYFGFGIDVKLVSHEKLGFKSQSINFFRTLDQLEGGSRLFSFQVDKMPTDIAPKPTEGITDKSTCHFTLHRGYADDFTDDEIEHLGAFLHKLFAALAKSANYVPRGGLRENLMLSLMLSWSAPGIASNGVVHRAPAFRIKMASEEPGSSRDDTELNPAEVFGRLAKTMAGSVS
jgi:hypothetical protein